MSDVKVKDDPVAMEVDALKRANKLNAEVERDKVSPGEKACEVEWDLDDKECPCHRGVGSAETQKKEAQQCRSALLIRPVSETSAVKKETRSEVRTNKFRGISDGPLSYLVRSVCSAMDSDPGVVEAQSEATTIDRGQAESPSQTLRCLGKGKQVNKSQVKPKSQVKQLVTDEPLKDFLRGEGNKVSDEGAGLEAKG